MDKKGLLFGLLIMFVVAIIVFFVISAGDNVTKKRAELTAIFQADIEVVNDFHADMMGIRSSLNSISALRDEMSTMKLRASEAAEKLNNLNARAYSLTGHEAIAVKETIEKSRKYALCYVELSEQKATRSNVKDASEVMLDKIESTKNLLGLTGSPDKADVGKALDKTCKLANNFQRASQKKSLAVVARTIQSDYPTWVSSDTQRTAFDRVRQMAQDIVDTRRFLGSRAGINWNLGRQYGNWTYFERSDFQRIFMTVRERKIAQIAELKDIEQIEGMSDLSNTIRQMLQNSAYAMEALIGHSDYDRFKGYSGQNDILALKLKRVYGITSRG